MSRRTALASVFFAAVAAPLVGFGAGPASASVQWHWPLRQRGLVTGAYETQSTDYTANPPWHHALDLTNVGGDQTVCAIADGVVDFLDKSSSVQWYGNYVRIRHVDGYWSSYAHLRGTPLVQQGNSVIAGTPLGFIGNTGTLSRGNHLHLEVLFGGTGRSAGNDHRIDPQKVLIGAPLAGENTPSVPAPPIQEEDMPYILRTAQHGIYTVSPGCVVSHPSNVVSSGMEYRGWGTIMDIAPTDLQAYLFALGGCKPENVPAPGSMWKA